MGQAGILLSSINAKWIHPSLALRLLKAGLEELEENSEIIEFNLRQPLSEKTEPILAAQPRIFAMSVSIWNHRASLELLSALEETWRKRPVIILGGPEVSELDETAEIFRYADHVIRGEGETTFRELCRAILKGKNAPKFIDAETPDLSSLPFPYRLYTDEDLTRKLTYVEASRGCPFGCEFCQSSIAAPGAALRMREFPLEPFLEEMDMLIKRGAKTFKFLDRSFNVNAGRAGRIMEFFLDRLAARIARGEAPFVLHFEMIPLHIPRELREIIARFPPLSLRLEIGIQTFNRESAALVKRPGVPDEELEILRFLRQKTNAIIHADLIAGLPGEDFASFGKGFDLLWKVLSEGSSPVQAEIQCGILKLLPGTAMTGHSEAFGMRYAPDPPYEALETAALPPHDLDRIKNFARFWELVMNRRPEPALVEAFPGGPVFGRFMELSDRLLARFGRNWGIDRKELMEAVSAELP